MAFLVDGIKKVVEYRGTNNGLRKDGKEWMSLRCESLGTSNTRMWEINVPESLQGAVYRMGLRKGDVIEVQFTARCGVAQGGRNYDYLELENEPQLLEVDDDGVVS